MYIIYTIINIYSYNYKYTHIQKRVYINDQLFGISLKTKEI